MCDEYPVAFWKHQEGRYEATLRPGMTVCVESYRRPWRTGRGSERTPVSAETRP
jgi:hypothetical protein